ncbi:putative inactive ATP-dependent zinc metalloprotease FTSHI 4, chloroplastic [Orobanche hederae]
MRREFGKRKKVSDSVSSTYNMFVGVASSRVKDIFASARSFDPSIIFIDVIDAIGSKRGGPDIGGVLVIGATNRLDILDPALLRKRRFDKIICVGLPSKDGRFTILKNEADILTARKDLDYIGQEELLEALKRQKGTFETGQEDSIEVPEELKLRLAYREAVVAVLACYIQIPTTPLSIRILIP